jgi:hypothetical protein
MQGPRQRTGISKRKNFYFKVFMGRVANKYREFACTLHLNSPTANMGHLWKLRN